MSQPVAATAVSAAALPLLDILVQQRGEAILTSLSERLDATLQSTGADGPPLMTGLRASAPAILCASWFQQHRQTALCVVPTREGALQLADDLEAWLGRDQAPL